jgi:hypothetical protein
MPNEPVKPSGAEEFVAAEIELTTPLDAEQEKSLLDALAKIESTAFDSFDVAAAKISFSYDPTRTNKEALLRLIKTAGGKLKHIVSESSPLVEPEEPGR